MKPSNASEKEPCVEKERKRRNNMTNVVKQ